MAAPRVKAGAIENGLGGGRFGLLEVRLREIALGTFAVGIETGGEDCTAVGAAGPSYCTDHPRRPWPELIGTPRSALRRLALVRPLLLIVFFRIAVPAMAILSVHKRLRPSALADCHYEPVSWRTNSRSPWLFTTGLLHSTASAIFPRVYESNQVCRRIEQEMGHLCL